jgi:glycosyltransferase involved in cell wall biosynthesis
MSTVDVSVVICTYTEERWGVLSQAIGSLREQTLAPCEVVLVVDNNPALFRRSQAQWPDLLVIENREQKGLSDARNAGVAASRGEVIAFLDDDAVAERNWLEELVRAYNGQSALGVGGAIEGQWVGGRPEWFPDEFDWVVGCTYRGLPTVASPVRNVIGANMSFRRDVFDTVGGFRAEVGRVGSLPAGCEETEFCIRVRRRWPDRVVLYDPTIRVRHRVPRDRARWSYFVSRCYTEGRSKAIVADLAGRRDALATELSYATRVLPQGLLRELGHAARRADAGALARAGAIVVGLAVTSAGFVVGRATLWLNDRLRAGGRPQ